MFSLILRSEAWWKRNREKNKGVVFFLFALALITTLVVLYFTVRSYS